MPMKRYKAETALATAFIQRGTQFLPGSFKLGGRTNVAELVEAGEFQQDVQTAIEGARSTVSFNAHTVRRGTALHELHLQ